MPQFQRFNAILLIIAGATLTACGGSNGGSGPPPPPPAQLATITAVNAPQIAAAVYQTVITADDVAGLTAPTVSGPSTVSAKSQSSVMAVDEAEAEPCLVNGRASITISDSVVENLSNDPAVLAPGDRFEFGFENCDDGDGFITDGNFDIAVTGFSGDFFGLYRLQSDVTMTDFSLATGDETVNLDADMSIDFDLRSLPVITIAVSGGFIDELTERTGAPNSSTSLSDFSITTTIDETNFPAAFQTTGSGALMNSDFDGEVTFTIDTALRNLFEENPTSGVIVIVGANDATVTITALSATEAQLEIDLGDGSAVQTVVVPWDDLLV